ncbi:exopolygalacturonase-like [Manihot esculenta]|uniref:exopolygalacturonase-like n=1 Tax=Manihot esculenta TaxID=3983 RepID=UPI001CC82A52|nr:exopolygalacturonase-like [Manihot esculenta]XP_043817317.1 exopolygalacturonase-like [Manihot esculenta]XP_043817324.1 exopolygalacturonase-like [Manihot esculenta]
MTNILVFFSYSKTLLILGFIFLLNIEKIHCDIGVGGRRGRVEAADASTTKVFDITTYGAKGDDKTDCTMAFMKAWKDSCKNDGPAKIRVPKGTFMTAPITFQGPCKSTKPIIVEVQGTVKGTNDLSKYTEDTWFLFEKINGVVLTGGGTFDGQGSSVWKNTDCEKKKDCGRLPTSIKFQGVTNAVVSEITSINSKHFHFHITDCTNFKASNLNIVASGESPNTDGMHISDTNGVVVTNSKIGTGDDCISIGQGVTNAAISKIFCGPGHGLSIGSLGKYKNEADVKDVTISDCTLFNTTNGLRIKTWADSPPSAASSITFKDIIMKSVKNPIIIDQKYGSRSSTKPSRVKISNVHYNNIRGTSTSKVAVNFLCSPSVPCEKIELDDVDLTYTGIKKSKSPISASCVNAKTVNGMASFLAYILSRDYAWRWLFGCFDSGIQAVLSFLVLCSMIVDNAGLDGMILKGDAGIGSAVVSWAWFSMEISLLDLVTSCPFGLSM